jgi:DNA (cytosine-5)-methyltransferase 1
VNDLAQPTAIDLFSGCGGLTTGLKLAGFRVLAAIEREAGALEAYAANHPDVPHVYKQDIREVTGRRVLDDLKLEPGDLDLLAGCPPCQGFSRMRTLNRGEAVEDPRNDLVREYLRLVRELLPRALMFENVPGLANDPRYQELLQAIRDLGYDAKYEIHNAADFGVPQRRRRLILLAARGAQVEMPEKLPAEDRPTVRSVIAELLKPGESGDPAHDVTELRHPRIEELIRLVPHDGGSRGDLGPDRVLACHVKCEGFYDVYGRMHWDEVSPTITSGFVNPSKGRFLHPEQDRCVTPREAALLQTFPPDYEFPMKRGKYPVATMIGNAFPPELARRHALAIVEALGISGACPVSESQDLP